MTTVKTEGFKIPGSVQVPPRPSFHRPFSDGSMSIETDILTSLDQHHNMFPMPSPFAFPQSLPNQPSIEQFMSSPQSGSVDLGGTSPHPHNFHASFFTGFKLENPEPPVSFPSMGLDIDHRSRSLSSSRASLVGKAPSNRSKPPRKLSMSDTRPNINRGRPVNPHPRTMSHNDGFSGRFGLGIGLDTHKEGERTDSISPPDFNGAYGVSIPRTDAVSWTSAPSLVPGSFGSYSMPDEAIVDSPITPAQPLPVLPTDDTYKKQRRRECHNQVEKRRREHINAKIEELSQLLPPQYNDPEEAIDDEEEEELPSGNTSSKKKKTKRSGSNAKQQKDAAHCKGRILSQSVQYIQDLKHITEMQAARIQRLESALMSSGFASLAPVPGESNSFIWTGNEAFSGHSGVSQPPNLAPLSEHHQLEVMRPSPELESISSWQLGQGHDSLMAFEPSPTEHSSGSGNNLRRSSSLSASDSVDGDIKSGLNDTPDGLLLGDLQGIPTTGPRKMSDAELHMSMSGMDLDAMFGGRKEEASNAMRW